MVIGVVGGKDSLHRIKAASDKFKDIAKFIFYNSAQFYNNHNEIMSLTDSVDGILFADIFSYSLFSSSDKSKLCEYVPFSISSFIELYLNSRLSKYKYFSIDMLSKSDLEGIEHLVLGGSYTVLPFCKVNTEEDYINFHLSNNYGSNSCFITGIDTVYNDLRSKELDVYRLPITLPEIKYSLNLLINKINNKFIEASKLAIQFLKIEFADTNDMYLNISKALSLENDLINYFKSCQATYEKLSSNEYLVYSTKGLLTSSSNVEYLYRITSKTGLKIYGGVGLGKSAYIAKDHALKAYKNASFNEDSCIVEMDEQGFASAPVFISSFKPLDNFNALLKSISKESGINIKYLYLINKYVLSTGSRVFTSHDIAGCLNLTVRSVNRILKQLEESGFIENYGKKSFTTGRPSNLFKLNFIGSGLEIK